MTVLRDLTDLVVAVRCGVSSAVSVVEEAIARADQHEDLNAFAYLDREGALDAARRCDERARGGQAGGALHGVPIAVKDLFQVADMPLRAGTDAPLPPLGAAEAPAVARLRAAGAIIVGKANMVEIALGASGENPVTGDVHHPRDPRRQAGGSSSGSAVAVATGMSAAALGSDTAGSIRGPASFCGVVGFKPTYGMVPMTGALPLCPTCDHAGPMTRSVRDAQLVFSVLRSGQPAPKAAPRPAPQPAPAPRVPRLGIPTSYLAGALTTPVRRTFHTLLDKITEWGSDVVEVQLPDAELGWQAYHVISAAEPAHVHRAAMSAHRDAFSPRVRAVLARGLEITAVDYLEAQRLRRIACEGVDSGLSDVDALLLPTTPTVSPLRGTEHLELESGVKTHREAMLRLTLPFSLAGVPAVSVPYGEVDGLPVGAQLVAARGKDDEVLALGRWLEDRLAAHPITEGDPLSGPEKR